MSKLDNLPLVGQHQKVQYPQISVSTPGGGNFLIEIIPNPVEKHVTLIQEDVMRQMFIAYGSTCPENVLHTMLQARAMNLGKIRINEDVRPADERPIIENSK